ncbi:MAG: hypothetical protein GX887_03105 [Firmicutes bacterium]|nr:hypothetical protein [Bacillota bacterium]
MKKVTRLIVACLDCGEIFTLSLKGEHQRRNYVCLNCGEGLDSSSINAVLNNALEYNNMVDWFDSQKDRGIELNFDSYR